MENSTEAVAHAQAEPPPRPGRPLPARPTEALPGSPEKVAVLAARAALRLQLFHSLDRKDGHSARDGYDVAERPRRELQPRATSPRPRPDLPEGVRSGADGCFVAFVHVDGRRIVLGNFRTSAAAAETARRARALLAKREGVPV